MAFWLALLFYVVAVVGGILYVVLRGLALKRALKRTGGTLGDGDGTHLRRNRADTGAPGPDERVGRPARGDEPAAVGLAARLEVQLQAVREARETMRRLLWFIPGV